MDGKFLIIKLAITSRYTQVYTGTMFRISITYTIKYKLKFAPNYVWTNCKKCINLKTGRIIKQVYNNGCIGYSINGKFYSLKKLKPELIKIKNEKTPF